MRNTSAQHLAQLQKNPKNIRNICILAHVDHGKTTIADALVSSNGIISSRLAGKLRYMDSREDEQIRGITMKSSAISLHFEKGEEQYLINLIDSPGHVDFSSEVSTAVRLCDGAIVVVDVVEGVCPQTHAVLRQAWLENIRPCLVLNKIDRLVTELKFSPLEAHIHLQQILEQVNAITGTLFSSQVMKKTSSSCNKTNLSAGATVGGMSDSSAVSIDEWSSGLEETDDSHIYFSPDLGNVVFASAIDGWGFGITDFADMLATQLGIKADLLQKTLWGDYYLHSKTKRIFKGAQAKSKKPLFVQFVLENLWAVYDAIMVRRDKLKTEQIVKSLKLKISARDSRYTDSRVYLQAVFSQWLPLSKSLLSVVVQKLPSPLELSEERVEKLMCNGLRTFESFPPKTKQLKQDFMACASSDESPVIVFVSKMCSVEEQALPHNRRRPLTQEEISQRREQARKQHAAMVALVSDKGAADVDSSNEIKVSLNTSIEKKIEIPAAEQTQNNYFMAFARVFSGVVKKGQKLYVLGPRHEPEEIDGDEFKDELKNRQANSSNQTQRNANEGLSVARSIDRGTNQHAALFTVEDLYLLMGRELEALESVPPGNVLGIGGLENHVLKSATISSTLACPPFTALQLEARPIVRVAVEPVTPSDMPALARGIRLLNQADPCVETLVQETGEHVIIAAGEVHLQRCVDDLKQRYARIELNVSAPIVPFRETVVIPPKTDMVNEVIVTDVTLQQNTKQQLRELIEDNGDKSTSLEEKGLVEVTTANKQFRILMRAAPLPQEVTLLLDQKSDLLKILASLSGGNIGDRKSTHAQMKDGSLDELQKLYKELREAFEKAGDEWKGAVDCIMAFGPRRTGPNVLLTRIAGYKRPSVWHVLQEAENDEKQFWMFDNSVVSGFQLATLAGPLCEEPVMGVCFVIEEWSMIRNENETIDESKTNRNKQKNDSTIQTVPTVPHGDCLHKTLDNNTLEHKMENFKMNCESLKEPEILEYSAKEKCEKVLDSSFLSPKNADSLAGARTPVFERKTVVSENEGQKDDFDLNNTHKTELDECSLPGIKLREIDQLDVQKNAIRTNISESDDCIQTTEIKENKSKDENVENRIRTDSESAVETVISTGSCRRTDNYGPLSGQIMAAVKEGCRRTFGLQPMRLMAAMYTCQIQATSDVLGKMYAVVYKREGRVISEQMREGSDVFDVTAVLPVAESFGFAEEIRKRTSGLAIPQLVFSHWEVVDIDPFWVPTTEEEYLHFGEKADSENQARKYMNAVRRRKGLYVEEKTVEHAEKQRTLKK